MKRRVEDFKRNVWGYYRMHGRTLPWRDARDPYAVLVSEFMLQQTQVSRVLEKYPVFLKRFPTAGHVARARLSTVVKCWQGLGYNRRAKMLKRACEYIYKELNGNIPRTFESLVALPGVGGSTAGAILAFAFNTPHPFIETNIRRTYIHHFFPQEETVSDNDLYRLIKQTVDIDNPREWFWALMDYGAALPRTVGTNPNQKSRHYKKQSRFEGSHRQVRGAIIRALSQDTHTQGELIKQTALTRPRIASALDDLTKEGFVTKRGEKYMLV